MIPKRVAIVPHTESMIFANHETLDTDCYWHGTVEELRQEGPEGKVGCISSPPFVCFLCLTYVCLFLEGLGQGQVVLEKEGL